MTQESKVSKEKENKHNATFEKLSANFPEAPYLYAIILIIGMKHGGSYNIDHLVFPEKDNANLGKELIQKSNLDQIIHYNLTTLIDHLPGAKKLVYSQDPNRPSEYLGYQQLLGFTQSNPGHLLADSIRRAQYLDIKSKSNSNQVLNTFLQSVKNKHFPRVLLELSAHSTDSNMKNMYDHLVHEDATDDLWKFVLQSSPLTDKKKYEDFSKGLKSAKARRSRSNARSKIVDQIKYYWLPLVLWQKDNSAILDALPQLEKGDKAEDHYTGCDTIKKTISRLNLTRHTSCNQT